MRAIRTHRYTVVDIFNQDTKGQGVPHFLTESVILAAVIAVRLCVCPQGEATEDFASDALVVGEGAEEQPTISRESVRAELDQLGVQQQSGIICKCTKLYDCR